MRIDLLLTNREAHNRSTRIGRSIWAYICPHNPQQEERHFQKISFVKIGFLPSEKRSTLQGNNLAPEGANSFLSVENPFQKELCLQEGKEEEKTVVFLVKYDENKSSKCIQFLLSLFLNDACHLINRRVIQTGKRKTVSD